MLKIKYLKQKVIEEKIYKNDGFMIIRERANECKLLF